MIELAAGMQSHPSHKEAEKRLAEYYYRNGHVRWPDLDRRKLQGAQAYKKGYEIRFVAYTPEEAAEVMDLLRAGGFSFGRPFKKARRIVIPVYGREAIDRFLRILYRK